MEVSAVDEGHLFVSESLHYPGSASELAGLLVQSASPGEDASILQETQGVIVSTRDLLNPEVFLELETGESEDIGVLCLDSEFAVESRATEIECP